MWEGGRRQTNYFPLFYTCKKKGEKENGGKAQTAVSFPNELNVMNEVESCKTQCGKWRGERGVAEGEGVFEPSSLLRFASAINCENAVTIFQTFNCLRNCKMQPTEGSSSNNIVAPLGASAKGQLDAASPT